MDPSSSGIIGELLKYGLAGVFIAYLIVVNWMHGKRYDELVTRFEAIQERRALEREQNATVLAAAADAQRKMSEATQLNAVATGALTERITSLLIEMGKRMGS